MKDKDFIKKLCSLADGFEWVEYKGGLMITELSMAFTLAEFNRIDPLYDLLLDRAIQGANNYYSATIVQKRDHIFAFFDRNPETYWHDKTTLGIREARVKALRYVLEEIG